jgi:transcriptional regulator with XRE-family HTH domain
MMLREALSENFPHPGGMDGEDVRLPELSSSLASCEGALAGRPWYEAEVSRSYLSRLEKGVFYASLKIVGKLAIVLEVEPAELLRLPPRRPRRL